MRLCLFALTGFGNSVLKESLRIPLIKDLLVFTRKEKGKFPYYDCEQLVELCKRNGVRMEIDQRMTSWEAHEALSEFRPNMSLVATFDQKIPKEMRSIPKLGTINIHPSLLPKYRGPTPTNWAIIHGEYETGVTFHLMTEEFDMGGILLQKKTSIGSSVDGELRKKLAKLSGEMLGPFLTKYLNGELKAKAQDRVEGNYFPKVSSRKGLTLLKSGQFRRNNLVRGLTPYPGVGILG